MLKSHNNTGKIAERYLNKIQRQQTVRLAFFRNKIPDNGSILPVPGQTRFNCHYAFPDYKGSMIKKSPLYFHTGFACKPVQIYHLQQLSRFKALSNPVLNSKLLVQASKSCWQEFLAVNCDLRQVLWCYWKMSCISEVLRGFCRKFKKDIWNNSKK